jgi:hypothetical protein
LNANLERPRASFSHGVVLIAAAAANADRTHNFPFPLQRDATSEDHDLAIIGGVNAEELSARLGVLGESFVAISNAREV